MFLNLGFTTIDLASQLKLFQISMMYSCQEHSVKCSASHPSISNALPFQKFPPFMIPDSGAAPVHNLIVGRPASGHMIVWLEVQPDHARIIFSHTQLGHCIIFVDLSCRWKHIADPETEEPLTCLSSAGHHGDRGYEYRKGMDIKDLVDIVILRYDH